MMLKTFLTVSILFISAFAANAQTNVITYQGTLNDGGSPANGTFDMRFQLYALISGTQTAVGTPVERLGVTVTDGAFTVNLDFSHVTGSFTGSDRFIGIAVRPAGGASFTTLTPTQQITSTPYAIRSQSAQSAGTATNSTQLGGIAASQYVVTTDPRMTDARTPTAGSANYIQNSTVAQPSSNFNISGDGTAGGTLRGNIVTATSGFNIGSARVLSVAGTNNTLVGEGAGGTILNPGSNNTMVGFAAGDVTTGGFNSFVGASAGAANTSGVANSFFGALAGNSNTTGLQNSFFGRGAGAANTSADGNSYFGAYSGNVATGADNSFFGSLTGLANTTGYNNSFFGAETGKANLDGHSNSFFGARAGTATTSGDLNAFFGVNSGQNNTTGIGNSFFGANTGTATTTGSNNSFFGRSSGASNTTGTGNAFFGALAGQLNSSGINNSFFGANAGDSTTAGNSNSFFGNSAGSANTTGVNNSIFGAGAGRSSTGASWNSYFGKDAGESTTSGGNNSFFGALTGGSTTSGSDNSFFGMGSGSSNTIGSNNTFIGRSSGIGSTSGNGNTFIGYSAGFADTNGSGSNNTLVGYNARLGATTTSNSTAIGLNARVTSNDSIVIGGSGNEAIDLNALGSINFNIGQTNAWGELHAKDKALFRILDSGGGGEVCRNASFYLSSCSSSLRYKTDVSTFSRGLELLRQLRPIQYTWVADGQRDVGFAAEQVAEAEPLLATYKDGQVEGVKYKQLTTVLVNAAMEQQSEIDALKAQVEQQRLLIEGLKQLVCTQNPQAVVCTQPK
ncbi:MAG: tail fiber domain-containing protein [Pyrinomonadaceae bacterium]|nr:tail fiber domain-containing protein [Pyrinomonadaceae bacterium]